MMKSVDIDQSLLGIVWNIESGNYTKAKKICTAVLEQDETCVDARLYYGYIISLEGDIERAIQEYLKCIMYDDKCALAHQMLGDLFCDFGKLEGGIQEYFISLKLEPSNAICLNHLSNAFFKNGNIKDAEYYCILSIEKQPDYAPSYCDLGFIKYYKKEYTICKELFGKYLSMTPRDEYGDHMRVKAVLEKMAF